MFQNFMLGGQKRFEDEDETIEEGQTWISKTSIAQDLVYTVT